MGKLEEFQNKLNSLISEIATVKKNITYYDVYNITDAVYDKNEFDAKVNALVNNSSLVVNTAGPFASNEIMYYPGDIVLKNAAGDLIHINAQTSGTYYPKRIDGKSGSYTISYGYVKDTPEIERSEKPVNSPEDAEPAQTISFRGLTAANPQDSRIYGIYEQFAGTTYDIPVSDNLWVRPLIKFYLVDTSGQVAEEISLEYTLQIGTNKYTVSIGQPIANLYIEVK